MTDSTDREWDYLKGRVLPRRTRGRSRFLSNPARASRLSSGWVVRGKPGAPESAHVRDAREANDPRRDADARRARTTRSPTTATARASTPITGEVVDETKARRTESALVRGRKASHRARRGQPRGRSASGDPRETARRRRAWCHHEAGASPSRWTRDPPERLFPRSTARDGIGGHGREGEDAGASDHPRGKDARGAASGRGDAHESGVQRRSVSPRRAREEDSRGTSDRTSCPRRKQPPGSYTAPPTTISGAAVSEAGVDGKCRRGAIDAERLTRSERRGVPFTPAREIYFQNRRLVAFSFAFSFASVHDMIPGSGIHAHSPSRSLVVGFHRAEDGERSFTVHALRGRASVSRKGPVRRRAGVRPRLIHLFGSAPTRNDVALASRSRLRSFPRVPTRGTSEEVPISLLHATVKRTRPARPISGRSVVNESSVVSSGLPRGERRAMAEDESRAGWDEGRGAASFTSPNSVTSLIWRKVSLRVLAPRMETGHVLRRAHRQTRHQRGLLGALRLEVAAVGLAVHALLVDATGLLRALALVPAGHHNAPVGALVTHGGTMLGGGGGSSAGASEYAASASAVGSVAEALAARKATARPRSASRREDSAGSAGVRAPAGSGRRVGGRGATTVRGDGTSGSRGVSRTRTIGAGRRARRPPRGCRRRRWSATSTRSACGGAVRSRAAKCSRRRCGGRWSLNRSHAPPGSAFWMRSRLVGAVQSSREIWIFLKRRWRWRASDRLGSPDLASTLVARTIRASIRHHG